MSNIVDTNDKDYQLCLGLSTKEFRCRCGRNTCHYFIANEHFLNTFVRLRSEYNFPLKINSGFRCQAHNEAIGGVTNSKHTLGRAVDISTRSMRGSAKARFIDLANKHFNFVKVYETFIHMDDR